MKIADGRWQIADLLFLKLGGSLITDKMRASALRPEILARLAGEIAAAQAENPRLKLVLGHGSGSFGHVAAKKHGTRQGVRTPAQWRGFAEVWLQASRLTRHVVEALHAAGLPAVVFSPSAGITVEQGKITSWDLTTMHAALEAGLLPVVYGDVAFDTVQGGAIVSTEDLFAYLAPHLHPRRILIAGIEPGVWADYPACTRIIPAITPQMLPDISASLGGSAATDVTGGMASKVREMLALPQAFPGLEVCIFSGQTPGAVQEALGGAQMGTVLQIEN